jgi:hypothetical protein
VSKFTKRLSAICRKYRTAIVIGDGWTSVETISDMFQMVFVFDPEQRTVKRKNVVYRSEIDPTGIIDVDLIMVDPIRAADLSLLMIIVYNNKPGIYIGCVEPLSKHVIKPIMKHGYELKDTYKNSQLWGITENK